MPITIQKESLFRHGFGLRYLVQWDNLFKPDRYSGQLKFYKGDSRKVVDVQILADRDKLKEEDIFIIIGEYHNSGDVTEIITRHTNLIYEICKASPQMGFLLDLDIMKIVENSDFDSLIPICGVSTLFTFENIPGDVYCLVNPAKNIKDWEVYSWLIAYIYSMRMCLTPNSKVELFANVFMQALSQISLCKGSLTYVKITSNTGVLADLSNMGENLIFVPGSTKRFEHLIENAMEQSFKLKKKR